MALKWGDKVVEQSTATTTGAYQLAGVPAGEAAGSQIFVAGIGDTNTCYYEAQEVGGTAWERGIGTVADAAPDTLTRTAIHASSNAGAAVDWTGKTVRIMCVLPSRRLYTDHAGLFENLTLVASRAAGAETIAIKTLAGADPSVADPVRIGFRNAAAGTGDFSIIELTSATSVVLSSGSTLGAVSGQAFRIWVVGFNDGGTFRLGAIKCALTDGVYGLQDNVLESSSAEGGAGAADSSGVIYTGAAVTSKAMRVLGYLEYTLTAAGTWDAAPSLIQLFGRGVKLPGDTVQTRRVTDGAFSSGTTLIPDDNTIPQITEGVAFSSTQAIVPKSAINRLEVNATIQVGNTANNNMVLALFRDSAADAIAAMGWGNSANSRSVIPLSWSSVAGSTSSTTFSVRAGGSEAGTTYFNGAGTAARMGGVMASFLEISEIMV